MSLTSGPSEPVRFPVESQMYGAGPEYSPHQEPSGQRGRSWDQRLG